LRGRKKGVSEAKPLKKTLTETEVPEKD